MAASGTQRQPATVCSLSGSWGWADADRRGRKRREWPSPDVSDGRFIHCWRLRTTMDWSVRAGPCRAGVTNGAAPLSDWPHCC